MILQNAHASYLAGDTRQALRDALVAWRAHPCPATREVLLTLDRKLVDEEGPLDDRNAGLRGSLLEEVESRGDLADSGQLAELLVRVARFQTQPLLEKLLARGPDPRVQEALVDALASRPRGLCAEHAVWTFWRLVVQDIRETAVPGRRALLERAVQYAQRGPKAFRGPLTHDLEVTLKLLDPDPILEDAPGAARFLADLAPSKTLESLWEAVYEDLSDLHRRQVLADALSEAGDPQGSFLTLQLLPRRSREQTRQMKALLKAHKADWLGELAPLLTASVTFTNGLPTRAKVKDKTWSDRVVGWRIWRSFEQLDLGSWGGWKLFENDVWPVLHTLLQASAEVVQYGPQLPALERLDIRFSTGVAGFLATSTPPPKLRVLSISTAAEGWAAFPWTAPLFERLERLEIAYGAEWVPHVDQVPPGFELVLHHWRIGELVVASDRTSVTVIARRPRSEVEGYLGECPLPVIWSETGA